MKKHLIVLATLAALFAATPALADADSGANGDGSTSNGGVVASSQGGFGSGF